MLVYNGEDFIIGNKPKFKAGEVVLYQNGSVFELGIIKTIVASAESGVDKVGKAKYKYRVWYHTGETTALTDEYLLHKLKNSYAFKINRLDTEGNVIPQIGEDN